MKTEEVRILVRYRLDEAQGALADTQILIEGKGTAISIINRSYYAMFYGALALLQTIGKTSSKHTGVLSLFDTEFIMKELLPRELGRNFHRAFEQRQTADYRITEIPTQAMAVEIYHEAIEFVETCQEYLKQNEWV
jgi:uncharacterized protein (UPF0332 family)